MTRDSQSNTPTVSVCVPSYNHARYIQTCLESIFAQTYKHIQLIVIDDGSTDDSVEIIEQALKECPFACELVVHANKGRGFVSNEGIEKSGAVFHAGISSDDMWLPEFIECRVKQLQSRPHAVLAYGHYYAIDENDRVTGCSADWADFEDGDARGMLLTKYPPAAQTVLFRKSALDTHKFNPEIFVEDFELFLRLCTLGEFAFAPDILSVYRTHSTNASRQTDAIIEGKIQAFKSNADNLGLGQKELDEIIARNNWNSVDFCLNSRQRLKAIKLALQNSHAKIPLAAKLRQYLKLAMPYSVLQATRAHIKKESDAWQGRDIKNLIAWHAQSNKC